MFDLNYKVDFARGVQKTIIRQVLATEDNLAHTVKVDCTKDGAEEDLTGSTVSGYFVRADGATVSLVGSVSGNVASVTLNSSCYKVEGRCYLIVKLTRDSVVSTIFCGEGAVSLSQTGTIIDDGEITLSLDELLAKITSAESRVTTAETQAEESATAAANAEASATASAEAAVAAGNNAVALKEACEDATAAANEAAERANQAADSTAWVTRMEAVEESTAENATGIATNAENIAANTEAIATKADAASVTPTVLWSGTWGSGTIEVPGITDWHMIQVNIGSGKAIGFVEYGSNVRVIGSFVTSSTNQIITANFSVNGTTCDLKAAFYVAHTPGSSHGNKTDVNITQIIGLIKKGVA